MIQHELGNMGGMQATTNTSGLYIDIFQMYMPVGLIPDCIPCLGIPFSRTISEARPKCEFLRDSVCGSLLKQCCSLDFRIMYVRLGSSLNTIYTIVIVIMTMKTNYCPDRYLSTYQQAVKYMPEF